MVIEKRCAEGGDLHYPMMGTTRHHGDGHSTCVCGSCEKDLYTRGIGHLWVLASNIIEEEPEEQDEPW